MGDLVRQVPENMCGHEWLATGLHVNSSTPGQNGRHFADDICKSIFVNEKFRILNKISLKYISKGLIYNKAALAQVMAWRQTGDKPVP